MEPGKVPINMPTALLGVQLSSPRIAAKAAVGRAKKNCDEGWCEANALFTRKNELARHAGFS